MYSSLRPSLILVVLGAAALVISQWIFLTSGSTGFLLSLGGLCILSGCLVGYNWSMYPWQIGIIGAAPSIFHLFWGLIQMPPGGVGMVAGDVFYPLVALATFYYGGMIGRWLSIRRKVREREATKD